MRWLDSLERRFHFVAIPQFPLFIATANGLIYLMSQFRPDFTQQLILDPYAILTGNQWWRVITFLFVPPRMGPIWIVFWLFMVYQYSEALETAWGEFRFFFFYVVGALATILASLLILHQPIGNVSLNTTLLLAFATLFPDAEILFLLLLPIKVKYLGWVIWASVALSFILGSFATKVAIGASLINYFLFFGPEIWIRLLLRWEVYKNRWRR